MQKCCQKKLFLLLQRSEHTAAATVAATAAVAGAIYPLRLLPVVDVIVTVPILSLLVAPSTAAANHVLPV